MNEPFVSIIIPVKNVGKTLERSLISVLNLDYAHYEVIVADDGSEDKTAKILEIFSQRLKVISYPQSLGPSRARNEAARQARGEFIAFTDGDCVVDKDWLRELLKGFQDIDNVASVGGRQEIPDDDTVFGKRAAKVMRKMGFLSDYMRGDQQNLISVNHNSSCNVMYRRDIFLKEEGFLEGLWPGEDVEFDYRLKKRGYVLYFNPKAIIYHYRPDNLRVFLGMMFRYGRSQGTLVIRYGFFRRIHLVFLIDLFFISIFLYLLFSSRIIAGLSLFLIVFTLLYICYNNILYLAILGYFFWHFGFVKGMVEGKIITKS